MTRNLTIATVFLLASMVLLGYIWVRERYVLSAREERFQGALLSRGARDYEQYCASCHGLTGEGGVANGAPRINNLPTTLQQQDRLEGATGIIAKYGTPRNFVEAVITSGVRGTAMPRWSAKLGGPLRDDQIQDIAAYISNWWAAPGVDTANISADAMQVAADFKGTAQAIPSGACAGPVECGKPIFQANCASCHTLSNKDSGVPAPGLGGLFSAEGTAAFGAVLPNSKPVTPENWVEWMKQGGAAFAGGTLAKPASGFGPYVIQAMPPFPQFTDEQIADLLAFLSVHDRNGEQTLAPIGMDGNPLPAQPAASDGQQPTTTSGTSATPTPTK